MKTNRSLFSRVGSFLRWAIVGACICTTLTSCGSKDSTAGQNEWKPFSSEAGNFSVLFPGTPRESNVAGQTTIGEMEIHSFMVETDPQTAYAINYNDFPPRLDLSDPERVFDQGVDSAVGKSGTVITQRSMRFKGYPAREFEFKTGGDGFSGRIRLILVGRRLYNLETIFLTGNPRGADREKFLDSFSLNKG